MSDRRLVVAECDSTSADKGKMFALAPGQAAGIGLPAFDLGNGVPAAGSVIGQGFYDKLHRRGFVWDGTAWKDIAPSPITAFATQALLVADTTSAIGTYATAGDTGNLFVKQASGWRMVGVVQYANATDLLADNPAKGTLGEAEDEDTLWERTATGWRLLVVREMADTTAILAWTGTSAGATVGDRVVDLAHGVSYVRTSSGWRPTTIWEETEANIRAATWVVNGQEAIASDTGRTFARIGGAWIEEPIQHYPTEALLLAATVPNGVLAWADDTNVVFTRAAGAWKRLQGPQISYGTTAPSTPATGDMWHDSTPTTGKGLQMYGAGAWHQAAPPSTAFAVGSVQQSLLTEAQWATAMGAEAANWMLADGRSAAGTKWATITGQSTVPDLRGAFIRSAGQSHNGLAHWNGGTVGTLHEYATARPRTTALTGVTSTAGQHHHQWGVSSRQSKGGGDYMVVDGWDVPRYTSDDGNHTHTVTINGGGDHETAPVHISMNTFIRVN